MNRLSWARPALRGAVVVMLMVAGPASAGDVGMALQGSAWGVKDETGQHQRLVLFGSDGLVSGDGGCNRFAGSYEQADAAIEIGGLLMTELGCAEDVMQREKAFVSALETARRIEVTDTSLKLYGADDALLLDLVRSTGH
ncbi:MAG: META domain-containing protein [Hyphomicrobiaceae bacterium]